MGMARMNAYSSSPYRVAEITHHVGGIPAAPRQRQPGQARGRLTRPQGGRQRCLYLNRSLRIAFRSLTGFIDIHARRRKCDRGIFGGIKPFAIKGYSSSGYRLLILEILFLMVPYSIPKFSDAIFWSPPASMR